MTKSTAERDLGSGGVVPGYAEYEIDIERVLRENLPAFFDSIPVAPLQGGPIGQIPSGAKGAYLLFKGAAPVYAGKTDSRHGFQDRLKRHAWTVKGRKGLDPGEMGFKAVRIMVFAALDVEAILISEMKERIPGALIWNNSGFGSNDPGKRRDGQEPAEFDRWYPIDFDFTISSLPVGAISVVEFLRLAKEQLPYLFRYEEPSSDLKMHLPKESEPLSRLMRRVLSALPAPWQCTVLHGRVILYPGHHEYAHHQEILRR